MSRDILVVIQERYYCYLVDKGPGCCQTSSIAQDSPFSTKNQTTQNVNKAEVENPDLCCPMWFCEAAADYYALPIGGIKLKSQAAIKNPLKNASNSPCQTEYVRPVLQLKNCLFGSSTHPPIQFYLFPNSPALDCFVFVWWTSTLLSPSLDV